MKNDKRMWLKFFALLSVMLLVFAACGEDEEPVDDPVANETEGAEEPTFTLINDGTLTVGSDIPYPPFEFNDEASGDLTGFDVEVVRAVAERLGLENPDDAWITTDFGTIFQQLASGTRFDIVVAAVTGYAAEGSPASETVAERTAVIDFTDPYYPSLQSLTVDTSKTDVQSVDELQEGDKIGIQSGTTGAFYAQENLGPNGIELVEFDKAPAIYQALQSGQIIGVFNDLPVSLDAIADFPNLQVVEQVETGEEYAIAVSKDNPELREAINGALEEIYSDGTYAEIFQKYFPDQELPSYASE